MVCVSCFMIKNRHQCCRIIHSNSALIVATSLECLVALCCPSSVTGWHNFTSPFPSSWRLPQTGCHSSVSPSACRSLIWDLYQKIINQYKIIYFALYLFYIYIAVTVFSRCSNAERCMWVLYRPGISKTINADLLFRAASRLRWS